MKEKTFYNILIEFTFSIEKTKRRIDDLRLTKIEKMIIEGHLNIRKNLNHKVLVDFNESSPSDLPFVESQRQLIIGSALNNLSRFQDAENYLKRSIDILKNIEAPFFLFYSYHMLFTLYHNLNQPLLMLKTISAMKEIKKNPRQEVQYLICQFCYMQEIGNHSEARKLFEKIDPVRSNLTEGDTVRFLVDKFSYFIQMEDLDQARSTLRELKQYRNYQLSENYNFMKKLLDHLIDGVPLYIYDHQFESIPVLLHQLKVIQFLEENKIDLARSHWEALKNISPSVYAKDFNYKASTCLFSLALNKHLKSITSEKSFTPAGENKVDQLYSIFCSSSSPLHASYIHELIWGSFPEEKEDLKKVSRLISRVKAEKGVEIEFRKGLYFVVKINSSQAS